MTKVIEHGDILLVEVGEKAKNFMVVENELVYLDSASIDFYSEELPQGNWNILGKASELTEEQWGKVVEFVNEVTRGYKDYTPNLPQRQLFNKASQSGHSLLSKYGLKAETTLILIKQ